MKRDEHVEVLFVEDRPEDADLAMRSLRKYNLVNEIKHLEDGQQAIDYLFGEGEYADNKPELPKMLLLDLHLPKINGLEVLERMKNEPTLEKIPVVVLTSSNADIDIRKAYELGANSYIVKPVNFQSLIEVMKHIGYYWMIINPS